MYVQFYKLHSFTKLINPSYQKNSLNFSWQKNLWTPWLDNTFRVLSLVFFWLSVFWWVLVQRQDPEEWWWWQRRFHRRWYRRSWSSINQNMKDWFSVSYRKAIIIPGQVHLKAITDGEYNQHESENMYGWWLMNQDYLIF